MILESKPVIRFVLLFVDWIIRAKACAEVNLSFSASRDIYVAHNAREVMLTLGEYIPLRQVGLFHPGLQKVEH